MAAQQVFNALLQLDVRGASYILEAAARPRQITNYMAALAAHPLQRVPLPISMLGQTSGAGAAVRAAPVVAPSGTMAPTTAERPDPAAPAPAASGSGGASGAAASLSVPADADLLETRID